MSTGPDEDSDLHTGIHVCSVLRSAGYPELATWVAARGPAPTEYALPVEPPPEVIELQDKFGSRWEREDNIWYDVERRMNPRTWPELLARGPLTPPEPDSLRQRGTGVANANLGALVS